MLELWGDLVRELFAIYRGAAATGAGWIAGLEHEIGYYAVEEQGVVVAAACKGCEVLAGLGGISWNFKGEEETLRHTFGA